MAGPLALNLVVVGHDSWADANRFGPGYLNRWAFGPESHSTRRGLPGITVSDGNRVFLNLPEEDGERQGNYEKPPSAAKPQIRSPNFEIRENYGRKDARKMRRC